MPKRDPDQIFRGSFQEPPYFEDLTERCALKLTSLMRFTGRPHFTLWQDQVGGTRFREDTGQYIPIFYLELEVLDVPVETRAPVTVEVEVRLARERVEEGMVPRLLSEGRTRVLVPAASGTRHVGSTRKLTIFAHLDPKRGRVTELHPSLEMGPHPRRTIEIPRLPELLRAPVGYAGDVDWTLADREPQVWSYQQTDPNRHIHAMEYPRMLDLFVTRELARRGVVARDSVFSRARIFFARPCYTGESYVRRAKLWKSPAGDEIVCAALFKADASGAIDDVERPATVCWLMPRSHEAASGELLGFGTMPASPGFAGPPEREPA